MNLDGGLWKIWGQPGPEFHQRFTGTFSGDGIRWGRDFDLTYLRVR
jgi:hypothetical protein